jgi:hypothetical protein
MHSTHSFFALLQSILPIAPIPSSSLSVITVASESEGREKRRVFERVALLRVRVRAETDADIRHKQSPARPKGEEDQDERRGEEDQDERRGEDRWREQVQDEMGRTRLWEREGVTERTVGVWLVSREVGFQSGKHDKHRVTNVASLLIRLLTCVGFPCLLLVFLPGWFLLTLIHALCRCGRECPFFAFDRMIGPEERGGRELR